MKDKSLIIFICVGIVISILILLNNISYNREVAIIGINQTDISKVALGFQTIPLMQGFTNPSNLGGNLTLNYEIQDINLEETIYIGDFNNIGNGYILIPDLNFPDQGSWKIQIKLRDKNLNLLDSKCSIVNFALSNGHKSIVSNQMC